MVMDIQTRDIHDFVGNKNTRRSLAQIDGKRGYTEVANSLLSCAQSGGWIATATSDGVLVGCFGYSPVSATTSCYNAEFFAELGKNAKPVFFHNVWVRSDYRGQGLSLAIFDCAVEDAQNRGYTHIVGFMPETDVIEHWARALPGVCSMLAKDNRGGPIVAKAF